MVRARSHITGAVALLVAAASIACTGAPEPAFDRIVFVTIDTLRADHLASFGYPIDTAPFVDRLAAEGTSFRRAFAHSATTGPSHSSMFTALYPMQHRVQNNGQKLDDRFVTLAERFNDVGFSTAAFVSGMAHFGRSNIAQGFQHYHEPDPEIRVEGGREKLYAPADETTDEVLSWLRDVDAADPFFAWVHYYDPHRPYRAPAELIERATPAEGPERERLLAFLETEHRLDPENAGAPSNIRQYDAEIMLVDTQLERLFNAFEQAGINERTLWVITSDHGQGLGNHGWMGHHEQIYNVQLHVPLIFWSADGTVAAGDIDDIVEQVDIPVTLLELAGAEMAEQVAPVQGRSLVPFLHDEIGYEHKQFAFAERRFNPRARPDREAGERYALQDLRYKYLWFSEGPDEFYDVFADPYETVDLIDEPNPRKDDMRATIEQIVAVLSGDGEAESVDEETLERLRALGYLR